MTNDQILENIKQNLGYPTLSVYTEDKSIMNFIQQGFDFLSSYVSKEIRFVLPLREMNKLDRSVIRFVVDVVPYTYTTNPSLEYVRDDFTLAEAMEYYNLNNNSIIVPVVATMLYNQINNAFNMKFDWHYDKHSGILYTTNVPDGATCLAVTAKAMMERDDLEIDHENWLFNYALAQTKITEGTIRRKYKEGSVGAVSDGDTMVQEGTTELQAIKEQASNFISLDIGRRR